MRLCAVSVDLDEMRHYYAIHGLLPPRSKPKAVHAVYDVALARFGELSRSLGVPLTFFVVGADLERSENAERLAQLAHAGHEMGNHSYDHLYDLSRRSPVQIKDQIARANDAIFEHTGSRPAGFRAPGYVMNDKVYAAVAGAGLTYSSSLFPCPYYYVAKLAKLGALRWRGITSEAILDAPRVLGAPTKPYHVGTPYWRRGSGVLELPIQVTPLLRLPFIGTSLALLGPERARWLVRLLGGRELVNLELHGIDLLDERDQQQTLAPHQFDLRIPLERKRETLVTVIEALRKAGYTFVRLDEAAKHYVRARAA